MSKKKIAVILASTVLIASLAIGGTLAYLTSNDTKINTFTVGNVKIALTEPAWHPAQNPGSGVLPGDTIPKDPTVTATAGDSYMRVKVEIVAVEGSMTAPRAALIKGTWDVAATSGFTLASDPSATDTIFYYNYNSIFSAADPTVVGDIDDTATLFTNIIVPGTYDNDDILLMGKYNIVITAQAIQSDNFATPALAYYQLPA